MSSASRTDRSVLGAGVLALIGLSAHVFVGERWIFRRLPVENLPALPAGGSRATSRYLRVVWHLFSADLLTTAIALILAGTRPSAARSSALRLTAAHFLAYTGVAWSVARMRPRLLARAPQWVLFLLIAALAARGARASSRHEA